MFFIGVMGLDNKEDILREVEVQCPNCNVNHLFLLHSYNRFHFFFLPILKWEHNYYLLCKNCDSLYGINKEKGYEASIKNHVKFTYWDLSPIRVDKLCESCKKSLNGEFEYCPYCGHKQTTF